MKNEKMGLNLAIPSSSVECMAASAFPISAAF